MSSPAADHIQLGRWMHPQQHLCLQQWCSSPYSDAAQLADHSQPGLWLQSDQQLAASGSGCTSLPSPAFACTPADSHVTVALLVKSSEEPTVAQQEVSEMSCW